MHMYMMSGTSVLRHTLYHCESGVYMQLPSVAGCVHEVEQQPLSPVKGKLPTTDSSRGSG